MIRCLPEPKNKKLIYFFNCIALHRIVLNRIEIEFNCIVIGVNRIASHRIASCFISILNVLYRWLCIDRRIVWDSLMEMHIPNIQVHINKLECRGKVHLFQYFNSNCETRELNKFNAHRLK